MRRGDWALLRDVRLRALRDAPYAFSSWLERELEYPAELWQSRAEQGERGATFVAIEDEHCLGMAGGYFAASEHETATLWGLWVEPDARRRGLGRALVEAVAGWARASGAASLCLDLTACEEVAPAAALYRQLDFEESGELKHPQSNRPLTARVMARGL